MLSPRWEHDPLNGAGAARNGGRYNRTGASGLYLSEEHATAIAEYQQDLVLRPGTLCAYVLDVNNIADLTDEATRSQLKVEPGDLLAAWKEIAFLKKETPPTWALSDRLPLLGFNGVRAPSAQRRGGINIVLWRWNDVSDSRVTAIDPFSDLPQDQSSWQKN